MPEILVKPLVNIKEEIRRDSLTHIASRTGMASLLASSSLLPSVSSAPDQRNSWRRVYQPNLNVPSSLTASASSTTWIANSGRPSFKSLPRRPFLCPRPLLPPLPRTRGPPWPVVLGGILWLASSRRHLPNIIKACYAQFIVHSGYQSRPFTQYLLNTLAYFAFRLRFAGGASWGG